MLYERQGRDHERDPFQQPMYQPYCRSNPPTTIIDPVGDYSVESSQHVTGDAVVIRTAEPVLARVAVKKRAPAELGTYRVDGPVQSWAARLLVVEEHPPSRLASSSLLPAART